MPEYHVGCGAFAIYAGTLNSRNKNLWLNKSEVTHEAVSAVAQYLLQENKSMRFEYKGKRHNLRVVRSGKWIDSNIPDEKKYVCSECGGACWYYDYQGDVAKSRYCPNCGARMDNAGG